MVGRRGGAVGVKGKGVGADVDEGGIWRGHCGAVSYECISFGGVDGMYWYI